jgi:hypothetical protein
LLVVASYLRQQNNVYRLLSEAAQKNIFAHRKNWQNNNPALAGEKEPFNPFGHPCGLVSFYFIPV